MKITTEIYLMVLLMMYSCNHKGTTCIEETVESFAAKTEFNYFDFALAFEEYLIENQILADKSKEAWVSMFQNRSYCNINYDHFISAVDNSFSTSPTIGGAYVSCGKENEFFVELSLDSLEFYGIEYSITLLQNISDKDFTNIVNKSFFVYQANILFPMCE